MADFYDPDLRQAILKVTQTWSILPRPRSHLDTVRPLADSEVVEALMAEAKPVIREACRKALLFERAIGQLADGKLTVEEFAERVKEIDNTKVIITNG